MKPIGLEEIHTLKNAIQYFQDCYLVSAVGALAKSSNGRKILSENIAHTDNGFRIKFRNINEQEKDFFVTQKEMDDLVYMDKYMNPIPIDPQFPHNPIIKALEAAMNKLLKDYPSKKPWICRLAKCHEKFEFNKPSNFLEMFTGKKPIKLNEDGISLNLKSKENTAKDIFNKISENPDSSFVFGTSFGFYKYLSNVHCYSLQKIDAGKDIIELFDHRRQKTITLTIKEAIQHIKFVVGYFAKDFNM